MKHPDVLDYGDFYDEQKQETEEYRRYARDIARFATVRDHARNVIAMLMVAEHEGVREDDFAAELAREHRTHQQGAARQLRSLLVAMTTVLEAMAEAEYDGRNEGMVLFARAAVKATEKISLPFI